MIQIDRENSFMSGLPHKEVLEEACLAHQVLQVSVNHFGLFLNVGFSVSQTYSSKFILLEIR